LIVYIRDFKSSKKFEPVPPEVTKKIYKAPLSIR
jgi:hypothetical protein